MADVIKPGETNSAKKTIFFGLYDKDGLIASGDAQGITEGWATSVITFSVGDVKVQHDRDGYANAAGTVGHDAKGRYYYIFDNTEVAASLSEGTVSVQFVKTGYRSRIMTVPFVYWDRTDIRAVNGDATAPANLAAAYNGSGYVAATAPAQQQQVANIAVTGAALNATASSRTITTGSGSGGVGNTTGDDGVYDTVSDSAGTLDFYYEFNVSTTTNAVGVGVGWNGYVVGVLNTVKVYAYNWGGAAWDQVGSLVGIAGVVDWAADWDLTTAHTGTGGNLGLVRLRFAGTGLTSASVKTDRILLGYAVTPATATTIAGSVWDTARTGHRTSGTFGETLPDAAAEAAGGLYTRGTGTGQINQDAAGRIDANVKTWKTSTPNNLVSGRVDADIGNIQTGQITAIQSGLATSAALSSVAADVVEIDEDVDVIETTIATLPTAAQIDTELTAAHGAGTWVGGGGTGGGGVTAQELVDALIAAFGNNVPVVMTLSNGVPHVPTQRAIRSLENALRRLTGQ